jgi:hypothetical protein
MPRHLHSARCSLTGQVMTPVVPPSHRVSHAKSIFHGSAQQANWAVATGDASHGYLDVGRRLSAEHGRSAVSGDASAAV